MKRSIQNSEFPIILPLNFPKAYDVTNPETTDWISLKKLKDWELAPYNAGILSKNEITFCITSSDLEDSKEFWKNLRLAIKKGLNKKDALQALTTTPAILIGASNNIGSLEVGKLANFIITSNDIFENGEIYENWTLGEQNIIKNKQDVDIRGYYTFNSLEFKNKLINIEGKLDAPKTIFYALDSNNIITKLSKNNLNLSNENGSFRAVGKFSEGKISGRYQNQKGEYYNFIMIRDSLFKENTNIEKNEQLKLFTPNIWFPNKAYGFNSKPKQKNILFKNATIWTNEEMGILENADIIISDGKIIAIGILLNPLKYFEENNYEIIDASNMHVTSGIIDEHSHIAISRGVNESSEAITAEVRIEDVINPYDHNIYRQLAGGTVAAQLLHGSANPIGGQSAIIKFRWGENAENMKISNADNFIKFALGENVKQSNWGDYENERFPQTRMGVEQVFYDAFYRASSAADKNVVIGSNAMSGNFTSADVDGCVIIGYDAGSGALDQNASGSFIEKSYIFL